MTTHSEELVGTAKKVGDGALKTGRDAWLIGVGAVAVAEEETRSLLDRFLRKGEEFQKSERNVVGKAIDAAEKRARSVGDTIETTFSNAVSVVLNRAGVPSRSEIYTLIDRVDELTDKIDALSAERTGATV